MDASLSKGFHGGVQSGHRRPEVREGVQEGHHRHYANALIGKKIGEDLDGLYVGLPGYKLQITGGSDKDGFPMRSDLPGPRRKRLLVSGGVGFHPVRSGMRKKKTVRGNTVSPDILQLNLKIVVRGPKSIEDAWQEQAR